MLRRQFLAVASAMTGSSLAQATQSGGKSLRAAAAARNICFGSEITMAEIRSDPSYANLIIQECAIITPGLEAKWAATEPSEGDFRLTQMDAMAAFATTNNLRLHMHNLIWSVYVPKWTILAIAEGRGAAIMARHIATLVSRYQDQAESWDVVNEAVDPRWPSGPEGLCNTPWRQGLGPGYVSRAIIDAAEASRTAHLLLNDDDLEYDEPDRERKRIIYLKLIEGLLRQNVPIGGFGLEAHLKPWRVIAEKPYRRFLADLADLGLKIYVTELDVCDRTLPADIGARDKAVASFAKNYLDIVLDEAATRTVITWGLSDRTSWMLSDPNGRRPDLLAPRPLPYDSNLAPKPMRGALMAAFQHARMRP